MQSLNEINAIVEKLEQIVRDAQDARWSEALVCAALKLELMEHYPELFVNTTHSYNYLPDMICEAALKNYANGKATGVA